MSGVTSNLAKTFALLVGAPVLGLLLYDSVAVRPHLEDLRSVLSNANPLDAEPPKLVRDLIDANTGSPTPYATTLVANHVYRGQTQAKWRVRSALWRVLLPLHFTDMEMYGFYATLSYNGQDLGLSNFAAREYRKPLDRLSSGEAAHVVAITHHPSGYIKDRERLARRAQALLVRSGHTD